VLHDAGKHAEARACLGDALSTAHAVCSEDDPLVHQLENLETRLLGAEVNGWRMENSGKLPQLQLLRKDGKRL